MAVTGSQAVSGRSMTKKGYQTDRAIKKLRGAFQRFSIHTGEYCFEVVVIYLSANLAFPLPDELSGITG